MGWFRRLRSTLDRSVVTEAFDEEARFHLEQRADEYVRLGMTPEEARRTALRRFGGIASAREATRDADTLPWLRDIGRDLRHAARQLRHNPGFAATAILTLAIGIGANTSLFSVVNELLLKPLPVPAPDELVLFNWLEGRRSMRFGMDGVRTTDEATGRSTSTSFSYSTFQRLKRANRTLTELFAFYPLQQINVVADGSAEVATGQYVSGNYFSGLGVHAVLGRTLTDHDDQPGAPPAATITDGYWSRRFNRDPHIVGNIVFINKTAVAVVGITPRGFAGTLEVTQSPDFTLPFAVEPLLEGERSALRRPAFLWVRMMGRLRPGISREQAAASLNPALQRAMLEEWHEARAAGEGHATDDAARTLDDASTLRAEPGNRGLMDSRRRYTQPLLLLAGCAALVLLTACVNIANLLLARGAARQRELATRLSLGASRWRLVRQLFTEGMLVALLGSLAGLLLARWGAGLLVTWQPWGGTVAIEHALDWRVFAFCAAMAMCTGVLFGLAPAIRATQTALAQAARRTTGAASGSLTRALVVGQVALSLVLLVAAGLFVGTLSNLRDVDKGFNADNLLLFRVQPQLNGYSPRDLAALYSRMMARIEAVPGVEAATVSRHALLGFSRRSDGVTIEGPGPSSDAGALVNVVAPSYFRTMGIPVLLGRTFDDRDRATAAKVAIVNERFATTLLGAGSPIGRRFRLGDPDGEAIEIVGVTRDAKYTDLRSPTAPTVYIPLEQDVPGQASFAVRTAGDALTLAPAIRNAVREIDATLPLFGVTSQADQANESVAKERAFARFSALLGSIAVLLTAIGLYGTMAYSIAQRTAEIGLRMALGAQPAEVLRMVVRQAGAMAVAGIVLGIPLALGAARAAGSTLSQVLFGLQPYDPRVLGGAAAILVFVAAVAAFVPARRAAFVDPRVALQHE